jgi:acid phosphatase (class A)
VTRRALRVARLVVVALLAAADAAAQPAPLDAVRFARWGREALSYLRAPPWFLTRRELLAIEVAPPPANGAASTRRELDELLRLQAARTEEEQRAIVRHLRYAGVCEALLATAGRPRGATPRTWALLQHVERDARFAVFHAKRRFERARPHQLEPRLRPSIPVPPHAAYPSGHAIESHVAARVLALLTPGRREALLGAALQVGHEREIAGVHFPSDGVASRALGDAIVAALERNPRFVRELEAARSEWR